MIDPQTHHPAPTAAAAAPLEGVAPLLHLGVIRVAGEDAASFLHSQLSQDFALLDLQHARLAALLTPKGRMLASFIGFRRSDAEVLLVCSRDLLAPTLKRLSMFVLRAKARISDATAEFQLHGLAGTAARQLLPADAPPWTLVQHGAASVVALYPADGQPRALWLAPLDAPAPQGAALAAEPWLWGEVRAGVATLSAPVAEAFVPQMLNYESIGGVNFKKGCYPGQEVVARSQFRGTLKRRTYLAAADAPMSVGQEVYHPSDADQPTGTIVACSPAPNGGWHALVSMQVSSADGQALHLGQAEGPTLRLLPLPYPLLDDI